ncbi:hypothetical protein [Pseudomonas sp. NPDC089401]|uniref:hypothetical protein n=1 Tax=Pseudomonas sp. NPDC089401 TaxID=3364462 RepID=UPI003820C75A
MLQVEYPDGHILDIGWRPSFDASGKLHIVLVKDHDWEHPAFQGSATNLDTLKEALSQALQSLR